MIVAVEGTKNFDDYELFMRGMSVALSQPSSGKDIEVWSAGPHKINSFTAAFCNSSENYLRNKGYKISFKKLPQKYISDNISSVGFLAYFSKKNEPTSMLVAAAELSDVETAIFRY